MREIKNKKIIILHDEISQPPKPDEADITININTVAGILQEAGAEVKSFPFMLDLTKMQKKIAEENPFLVFNLVDSVARKSKLNILPTALLETMEIAYTGCRHEALFIASDKILSKRILRMNSIATADWSEDGENLQQGSYIVKSADEHASIGLSDENIVDGGEVAAKIKECSQKYGGRWFAEKFLAGREFNVPLIKTDQGVKALPVFEICYPDYPGSKKPILDYSTKWDSYSFGYNAAYSNFEFSGNDLQLIDKIEKLAKESWLALNLSGYARADIRLDENDNPFILEINANPSLSPDADFFLSAEKENISAKEIIFSIVKASLKNKIKDYADS